MVSKNLSPRPSYCRRLKPADNVRVWCISCRQTFLDINVVMYSADGKLCKCRISLKQLWGQYRCTYCNKVFFNATFPFGQWKKECSVGFCLSVVIHCCTLPASESRMGVTVLDLCTLLVLVKESFQGILHFLLDITLVLSV